MCTGYGSCFIPDRGVYPVTSRSAWISCTLYTSRSDVAAIRTALNRHAEYKYGGWAINAI